MKEGGRTTGAETLTILRLPDGGRGALYRGQVFALDADGAIDVDGPFAIPGDCAPEPGVGAVRFALSADVPPLVLLWGGVDAFGAAEAAVSAAGAAIRSSGPYLAAAEGEQEPPQWYLLTEGLAPDRLEAILRSSFPGSVAIGPTLEDRFAAAVERELVLREALRRLRAEVQEATGRLASLSAMMVEAEAVRVVHIARLSSELDQAVRAAAEAEQKLAPSGSARRYGAEITEVVGLLLPRLELVRDSSEVMAFSIRDRSPILTVLRELHDSPGEALVRWKGVRGAAPWRERHFATGQDDSGRVYVRPTKEGRFQVLVSRKASQERDIAWMQGR